MEGLNRVRELVSEFTRLEVEERDLVDQVEQIKRKLPATKEPEFVKLRKRVMKNAGDRLAEVQRRQTAIVAECERLQAADASVPSILDDFDPGLASLRMRLHDVRQRLKHIRSLPPSPFAPAGRAQLTRELEEEANSHVRTIRRRESMLLTSGEGDVRG